MILIRSVFLELHQEVHEVFLNKGEKFTSSPPAVPSPVRWFEGLREECVYQLHYQRVHVSGAPAPRLSSLLGTVSPRQENPPGRSGTRHWQSTFRDTTSEHTRFLLFPRKGKEESQA